MNPVTAAALERVACTLHELSDAQLHDLAAGRGRLVFTPDVAPSRRRAMPPAADLPDALAAEVAAIGRMTTTVEVAAHLNDRRFTVPVLRALARALGPTVPATGRNRSELVHGIVEGTVGFRARSAALSGGAWG
ncbi:MAG: hypothetical protein L0H64_16965 [Pseudonocardia sp.]|nr:hypothetical protein [Pseudonocardia sp.]